MNASGMRDSAWEANGEGRLLIGVGICYNLTQMMFANSKTVKREATRIVLRSSYEIEQG